MVSSPIKVENSANLRSAVDGVVGNIGNKIWAIGAIVRSLTSSPGRECEKAEARGCYQMEP